MKKIIMAMLILLLNLGLVGAVTQQELNEAKNLIDSKISCNKLTNEQLEIIGEYEMELMHPGQSHEAMHKMMGLEEGSEAEKQFHINMAKTIYCGESGGMMGGGMMGMMNMMGGGTQSNMMGSFSMINRWNFTNIIYVILLIGLIILVYLGIYKLWLWEPKSRKDSGHNNGGN